MRLAGALGPFWEQRGFAQEGREHLAAALAGTREPREAIARALYADAVLASIQGNLDESLRLSEEAVAGWRTVADPAGELLSLATQAEVLLTMGSVAEARASAQAALEIGRARVPELVDHALLTVALIDVADGDVERVEPMLHERIVTAAGRRDLTGVYLRHLYADCALQREDYIAAIARYANAAVMAGEIASRVQVAFELQGLAMALAGDGRSEAALEVDAMALAMSNELGLHDEAEWWERLRARHLGRVSATLAPAQAAAARSLGSERPPAERLERALALAQDLEP